MQAYEGSDGNVLDVSELNYFSKIGTLICNELNNIETLISK